MQSVKDIRPRGYNKVKIPRLALAWEFSRKPENYWQDVIFTDESKYNLCGPDGNKRAWRYPGSLLQGHHIRPVLKFGGISGDGLRMHSIPESGETGLRRWQDERHTVH